MTIKTLSRACGLVVALCLMAATAQAQTPTGTELAPFGQFSKQPWTAKYQHTSYWGDGIDSDWFTASYDDSAWETISGPLSTASGLAYYATDWGDNYYNYWLRRNFSVSQQADNGYLFYVSHDDGCEAYLNGVNIYSWSQALTPSDYNVVYVPKNLLKTGNNVLAVCVYDNGGEAFADFGLYAVDKWMSVELSSPGTLGQEVLYKTDMLSDVQLLRVKGAMNDDDWGTIKNMENLMGIDLSEATATRVPDEQFRDRSMLTMARLPKGITSIGSYAFYQTSIYEMDVPTTVKSIGERAFFNCDRLMTFTFASGSQLTEIGEYAFYDCDWLQTIAIPNGVTALPREVFNGCDALASVVLPAALESIRYYCFGGTSSLKSIEFPQTLSSIGESAFNNSGLEHVALPQNLSSIGGSAFANCQSLKTIELSCVSNIAHTDYYDRYDGTGYDNTFGYCTALEKVTCLSATPPLIYGGSYPFYGVDLSKVTLVVPAFAIVDYKLDDYWHQFGSILEGAEPSVLSVGSQLSLTNNRRPSNKVDVVLNEGAALTVGGNAPFEVGTLTFIARHNNYWDNAFTCGQLQNNTTAMTVDQVQTRFYAHSDRWYFITPLHDVNVSDVVHENADAAFVFRYYNGQNRAANGPQGSWQDLTDNTLKAGQGYIFQTNRDGWLTLPATATGKASALISDDATTPLKAYAAADEADASWNFVGNPYPCYYDTYYMELASPITVWDNSNYTYRAYSPIDDDYVLRPMEAFFVQKPSNLSQVLFPKEGRQFSGNNERTRTRSWSVGVSPASSRQLFDIAITDGNLTDLTRLVVNPEASTAYETGRDAAKFLSTMGQTPQLYTVDSQAGQLAINERPLSAGATVALAVSTSQAGAFTISLSRGQGSLLLHDKLTGQTTDLSRQPYTFTLSSATTIEDRFLISVGQEASTIEEIKNDGLYNQIENGKSVNSKSHDLQGRIATNASKGIVVRDGKKYVVK